MTDATTIIKNMSPDEYKLRSMLCDAYSGAKAYRDDGEMSDSSVLPSIDFLRDSVDQIEKSIQTRRNISYKKLEETIANSLAEFEKKHTSKAKNNKEY